MTIFSKQKSHIRGFTLMEVVIGSAVFLVIATAAYNAFTSIFRLANANQGRVLATTLANEQFEVIRNMPYSNIGEQGGIPNGSIPSIQSITRGGITFTVNTTVRNVDLPFDGQIGSTTNDLSPADNKSVEINVTCPSCVGFQPVVVTGQVAPKNLETASTNGALFVQAFDANGVPVSGASVHIAYTATSSPIIIDDTTNNVGMLQIVDVPPATQAYSITVTKSGYSTDRTYAVSGGNPTPTKPDATVALQTVTSISFAIDRLSTLNFSSVSPTCAAIPNFDFTLVGAKQIGASVPKYSQAVSTNASGVLSLSNMEWDSYTVTPTDTTYDLAGINPLNPISLSPNVTQSVQLIAVPKNSRSLMMTVKDSATQLPLSGVTVQLEKSGYDESLITGQGFINQSDWVGGSGQALYSDITKYASDDTNVDVSTSSGNIVLKQVFGNYNPSGVLESSTFDTGTSSNFYTLNWNPTSQPTQAGANSVKFQFATDNSSAPASWNFLGPDGTASTYYTSSGLTISSANNNKRYARYRAYLSTTSSTSTPTVSDAAFTYTSGCIPPGQVMFTGLGSGTYDVTVSKSGYTTYTGTVDVTSNWQQQQVILAP